MQDTHYGENAGYGASGDRVESDAGPVPGPRVAFIDGDDVFRTALAACLRAEGFDVLEYHDVGAALEEVPHAGALDAVLADTGKDNRNGEKLLSELRNLGCEIPVAVMARTSDNGTEEAAFLHGASDFLLKNRGPTIVAKRLHLMINGVKCGKEAVSYEDDEILEVGRLTLRLESHRALWRRVQVPLTVTEFKIVRLLACGLGRTYSYREIYDVVHGTGFIAGDGLDGFRINVRSLIKKIRQRFRAIDSGFDEIENVPGMGYRWRPSELANAVALMPNWQSSMKHNADRLVA